MVDVPPSIRSCLFHALFRPTLRLRAFVQAVRTQLYGVPELRYVAVHIRLGDFEGERKAIRRGAENQVGGAYTGLLWRLGF